MASPLLPRIHRLRTSYKFTDLIPLTLSSGAGGHGAISFAREPHKPIAPPDGGKGGKGGDVYIQTTHAYSLTGIERKYKANQGQKGKTANAAGKNAKDIVIQVPSDAIITELKREEIPERNITLHENNQDEDAGDDDEEEEYERPTRRERNLKKGILPPEPKYQMSQKRKRMNIHTKIPDTIKPFDILHPAPPIQYDLSTFPVGTKIMVLPGGTGGLGNGSYAGGSRTYQLGQPGQVAHVQLEYKTLADVGMVGFPNAGKSSILNALTRKKERIGWWPFTTLAPSLGAMEMTEGEELSFGLCDLTNPDPWPRRKVSVADIPGLVPGASVNVGLGHAFLRHITRTKLLLYIIDLSVSDPMSDLLNLRNELLAYDQELADRKWLVIGNKADLGAIPRKNDLYMREQMIEKEWSSQDNIDEHYLALSALERKGIDGLRRRIWQSVYNSDAEDAEDAEHENQKDKVSWT